MDEMDALADLGVALRPAAAPANRLRERVADDLAASATGDWVATVRPLAGRRRFRAAVLAVPVAAAAAAVVVASLAITDGSASSRPPSQAAGAATSTASNGGTTGGTGGSTVRTAPAAFTVATNADGSVTFTARDFVDTDAATRALRRAGLVGRVVNQQDPRGCPAPSSRFNADDLSPAGTPRIAHGNSVTMRSSDYPRGGGLFVAVLAQSGEGRGGAKVRVEILAFKQADRIPVCVDWLYAG